MLDQGKEMVIEPQSRRNAVSRLVTTGEAMKSDVGLRTRTAFNSKHELLISEQGDRALRGWDQALGVKP
jgi:hypothetical protein